MLDFLREARGLMYEISAVEVMGVPIDWLFHLVGAAVIVFVASRFLALKQVVRLTVLVLVAKEVFDIFAKTRAEYIRPPTYDLALDMTAGLIGIGLGYWLAKRYPHFLSRRSGT